MLFSYVSVCLYILLFLIVKNQTHLFKFAKTSDTVVPPEMDYFLVLKTEKNLIGLFYISVQVLLALLFFSISV